MCKSKSSADTTNTQTTETTSGTATGTVGNVYQGESVNVTDQFPADVADAFKKLIDLSGQAVDVAAGAGQKALEATNALATTVKQPDVSVSQDYQKTTRTAMLAAAFVAAVLIINKKG